MVNAWSLLWSELNGTMDEDYPIMSKNEDDVVILGGESSDTITFTSEGVGAADTVTFGGGLLGGMGNDHISFDVGTGNTAYDDNKYYAEGYDPYPSFDTLNLDVKPQPNLQYKSQKYEEEAGIKDLKDYISSTYSGHYTSCLLYTSPSPRDS